nr:uncharacterized protein LOC127489556 [Oryctolagus cuniculus]
MSELCVLEPFSTAPSAGYVSCTKCHRRDSVQLPPPARPLSAPPPPPLQNRGCYCKERVTPLLESSGCKLPLLCVYNFPQTCTSLRAQGPRKTIASITRTSTTKDTPGSSLWSRHVLDLTFPIWSQLSNGKAEHFLLVSFRHLKGRRCGSSSQSPGLKCQHPVWLSIPVLAAPLPIQLSAVAWSSSRRWAKSLGPCTRMEDPEEAPGSWLWIGSSSH